MFENMNIWNIIIIVLVVVLVYYLLTGRTSAVVTEGFRSEVFNKKIKQIDNEAEQLYHINSQQNHDIQHILIDQVVCHPSCCGTQWPVYTDGLNAEQLQERVANQEINSPFMKTNYTCANGPNGVGCPCIIKSPEFH